MNSEERFALVKRNTHEIVREDQLRLLLAKKKKPVVYWGTAVTGKPSVAYFFPLLKLKDFVKAGFRVKILLADLHGALDGTSWEVLERRYTYYRAVLTEMLLAIGTDLQEIEFVKGSEFQLKPEYMFDVLQLASMNTVHDCKKAAAEVVKFGDNPELGGLIYPIMQALDEVYLEADMQFGGVDQRKILMFARENLPKIGYDARVEIMNPMIPGLVGKKMSSSEARTKIDITDSPERVKKKIRGADMIAKNVDNGVMSFLKYVLFEVSDGKGAFIVKRSERYGGDVSFDSYDALEKAYMNGEVHPQDVKDAVADALNGLLEKIDRKKIMKLAEKAY